MEDGRQKEGTEGGCMWGVCNHLIFANYKKAY
jgi:hypothetical protein